MECKHLTCIKKPVELNYDLFLMSLISFQSRKLGQNYEKALSTFRHNRNIQTISDVFLNKKGPIFHQDKQKFNLPHFTYSPAIFPIKHLHHNNKSNVMY